MRIDRLFASVPLRDEGPGVFDRRAADSSALEASALVGRAQARAFAELERAEAGLTAAEVQQGAQIQRSGAVLVDAGAQLDRVATAIQAKETDQRRATEYHSRTAQYALDTDAALRAAAAESSPDGRDLAQRFAEKQGPAREKLFAGVDDPLLRDSLQVRARDRDALSSIEVGRLASAKLKQWSIDEFDKAEAVRLKTATEGRLDAGTVAQAINEHEAQVKDMVASGVLSEPQGEAARRRFRATVGRRVGAAELASDPAGYLARLKSGSYNVFFDPDQVAAESTRAFDQVVARQTQAALAAERAERRAGRALQQDAARLAKDGFDRIDKGEDIADFLAAHRERLGAADYGALLKANRREPPAASDLGTVVDLQTRLDREDVAGDAARAYRAGRLSQQDYTSIVGKNRAALLDEPPGSPRRAARAQITDQLAPYAISAGPHALIAQAGLRHALDAFDAWAQQNPGMTRTDAFAKARDITQQSRAASAERMAQVAQLPRGYAGTRADLTTDALDRAEATAVRQFDAKAWSRTEYMTELECLADWRSILNMRARFTATANAITSPGSR